MTAPTISGTRFPQPVDELLPHARQLVDELGEVPSRNQLMRTYRIGAAKARELRGLLVGGQDQAAPTDGPVVDQAEPASEDDPVPAVPPAGADAGDAVVSPVVEGAGEPLGGQPSAGEQDGGEQDGQAAPADLLDAAAGGVGGPWLADPPAVLGDAGVPPAWWDVDEPAADPWEYAEPVGPDPGPLPGTGGGAAVGPVPAGREPEHATAPPVDSEPVDAGPAGPNPGTGGRGRRARPPRRRVRHWRHRKASPQPTGTGNPGTARGVDPPPAGPAELPSLLRIRWAVRAVLALGVAASIAGNVLHARDELISQIISAWSPLALLLTIELISRVPVHRRHLALARWAATALIAGIAAWVSYWHMAAVAARYGETNGAQYLLPLSVDGLVVVASICLVELGGRIAARRTPLRT
ncbi:DUF2637 domain-containing protein [Micromonospora carbonacea]|uniref:DUF2637 domain-containing protein n=1 Tax=Micromonospora carbonacea TaxID=47853 RepID=UPI00179DD178|nr:DUF2637 domain-containing protein [Micromonospora carbonacea]MBB5828155.1 hypothetical protein [Micromonospora carbonacea]